MGASSSSNEVARADEAAELQRQRAALEAEKRRLEEVALAQHWAEKRLQEEQQQKEAVDKWRRKQHLKTEQELQRKMEELKMQQRLQNEHQQILQHQQLTALAVENTRASVSVRETVPVQQSVSSDSGAEKPSDPPSSATAAPTLRPAEPMKPQASLDTNEVAVSETSVLPKAKPESNKENPPETCVTQMNASNERYEEWSIIDYVMEENASNKNTAANVMTLLDHENTVSFIARYRRSMTGGMEEDELRNVKKSYERAKLIKQRAESIIKKVDEQGKWTPELDAFVHESKSLRDLDRIDSIFKVTETKDNGLGKIAKAVVERKRLLFLELFVEPAIEGRRSVEQVKDGIVRILADTIKKDIRVYNIIKKLRSKYDIGIETNFAVTNESVTLKRELDRRRCLHYDNFKSTDKLIAHFDISNIRRGEAEKVLTVKIVVPPAFSQAFKDLCAQLYIKAVKAPPLNKELITAAVDCMYDKWARPSIENWTREEIYEKAEIATMEIIVQYVKQLLLAPALRGQVVIGVFSLSQWVCKLAAVSERGVYLDSETIYPHNTDKPGAKQDAEAKLVRMVKTYKCTILAVGNGASCDENKRFISDVINKKSLLPLEVFFRVVDEAGLLQQFYSCSHEDSSEFPTTAAVSIARRLQDPLAEFVKIEPKHLVKKTYQQDVPEIPLNATLNDVIVEAVSFIGVDLNTASTALLRRVAGLDEGKAKSIVEWRDSFGPFTNRNDLIRVKGIGAKTFEQCAGFVRIMPETAVGKDGQRALQGSFNYFDQTLIHPSSYDVAKAFLAAAKCNVDQVGTSSFIFAFSNFAGQGTAILAKKFGTSKDVIELIVDTFTMERTSVFKTKAKLDEAVNTKLSTPGKINSNLSFDNLITKTILTGTVCNIKPYGAFINVGLERPGLMHNTNSNGMALSVGQQVETIVDNIDKKRQRFSLRLLRAQAVKPKAMHDKDVNTKALSGGGLNSTLSFDDLTTDTILIGEVCNIKPYGTFINVGLERPGLMHKTHSNGITLNIGQEVETIVVNIDKEHGMFGLRLLRAQAVKPKAMHDKDVNTKALSGGGLNSKLSFDDLTTDTILIGEVCNIKPYGTFINVGLERPGLMHKTNSNGITLNIGQEVETIVDNIDKEHRMFGLRFLRCI